MIRLAISEELASVDVEFSWYETVTLMLADVVAESALDLIVCKSVARLEALPAGTQEPIATRFVITT